MTSPSDNPYKMTVEEAIEQVNKAAEDPETPKRYIRALAYLAAYVKAQNEGLDQLTDALSKMIKGDSEKLREMIKGKTK